LQADLTDKHPQRHQNDVFSTAFADRKNTRFTVDLMTVRRNLILPTTSSLQRLF
jgi:hypothetical protein